MVELAVLGRAAVPYASVVAGALSDWHPKVRAAAARALHAMGGAAAAPHARALATAALRDSHREVRLAADEALRGINETDTVPCSPSTAPYTDLGDLDYLSGTAPARSEDEAEEAAEEDGPLQPQCWGLRLQQLIDFRDEVLDEGNPHSVKRYCEHHKLMFRKSGCVHVCLQDACPFGDHRGAPFAPLAAARRERLELHPMTPNMHAVVTWEVKPRTKPHGCSYALLKNPHGLRITTFVTHTWEEPFSHFVGTLQMALRPEEVVWVCSFALDQNADIKQLLNCDDLLASPFAKALRHAPKLIVTLDEQLKVPERSWCAFELEKACQWGIPTFMWPYHLTSLSELEARVETLDIRKASATDKSDQERIHRAIQEGMGYEAMNKRLRAFLMDRLRFYEAAVRRHVEEFAALARQMEEARKEKDDAKLAALEAESLGRSQLLQLEMERRAAAQLCDELQRLSEQACGGRGPAASAAAEGCVEEAEEESQLQSPPPPSPPRQDASCQCSVAALPLAGPGSPLVSLREPSALATDGEAAAVRVAASPPPVLRTSVAVLPAAPPPQGLVVGGGLRGHMIGVRHAVCRGNNEAYTVHSLVTITPF